MKNVVSIIPARGGSKGIPKKNLIPFCGKPLIGWSIEHALNANRISSVWVTSDCDEILKVSKEFGANTIKRPDELSGDTATSESAWLHALNAIEKNGPVDLVVALQPTSPLRESSDLDRGVQDFESQGCDSLFSCAPLEDFFIWQKNPQGNLTSLNYDFQNRKRRQDIQGQFVENGSFYIFKPTILRQFNNRLGGKIGISQMEFFKTFEIDCLQSLEMCEALMQHCLINKNKSLKLEGGPREFIQTRIH